MDVKEIETTIAKLPDAEVAELAEWFQEFHAQLWDKQIERDLSTGRLQTLLDEVKQDLTAVLAPL